MKNSQSLLLLLLFSLLLMQTQSIIDTDDVTITSVSGRLDKQETARGSLLGGTIVYIRGTGFNPQADHNVIHLGPYPCLLIADGATENFLSCKTTPATDPSKTSGLFTTIKVEGKTEYTCNTNNCKFYYQINDTPFIQEVCPRGAVAGQMISVYGFHRISDLGDGRSHGEGQVQNILIGDASCSLVDVEQLEQINGDRRRRINCLSPPEEAGQYSFEELVEPGRSMLSLRNYQTSFLTGQNYTQRIIPKITSMSSHESGDYGREIKVKGTSFSTNPQNYKCSVAGQECVINEASQRQLSISIPAKSSGNSDFGKLNKDISDTAEQQQPFIGGGGALYSRYARNRGYSLRNYAEYISQGLDEPLQEKIVTEVGSPERDYYNSVEFIRGYLHAPVDGAYTFTGIVDDYLLMQVSTVANTTNIDYLVDVIDINAYSTHEFVPYQRANQTKPSGTLNLKAGYYYYHVIGLNGGGAGFFKVLFQAPQIFENLVNPTWQLDRVIIKPTSYTAEELEVRVTGASGTFDLSYVQPVTFINRIATIDVGSSQSTFRSKLNNLPNIRDYSPSVTLRTLNAQGNDETDTALIETYVYLIKIDLFRELTDLPAIDITDVVSSENMPKAGSVVRLKEHSPEMSGTYKILVDGTPLDRSATTQDFQLHVNPDYVAAAFNNYYGTTEMTVLNVIGTNDKRSIQFIIEYTGVGPRGALSFDLSQLTGGAQGSTISANIQVLRQFSYKPLYYVLPYDFLYLPSGKPTLQLSVNSIPAVCEDCSYEYKSDSMPAISSYTRSQSTITLGLTDPAMLGYTLDDISVSLLGVQCTQLTGTIDSFECQLPTSTSARRMLLATDPALPAGSETVSVHINQVGYADPTSVAADSVDLVISSMSPAESSEGGLIEGVITGSGLPISDEDTYSVSLCGNQVTNFKSISNTELVFEIPQAINACSDFGSEITVNGVTQPLTFSYNSALNPVITAIDKTSSSPILKNTLTIDGSGFGTSANTFVYLFSEGKLKYELTTTSVTTNQITCILGGGRSGIYDLIVTVSDQGSSISGQFSFEYRIFIDSLSITQGQKGGGYSLTINGQNLAPLMDSNNVFIGNAMNSLCEITQSSHTAITCTVPPMKQQYNIGDTLDVVVTGRVREESVCRGSCSFSYVEEGTPTIEIPDLTSFDAGASVTLSGTNLLGATVSIGDTQCVISQQTETSITFTYPTLPAGTYQVIVSTPTGWAYPKFQSSTSLKFNGMVTNGGSEKGHLMKYTGNGFPSQDKVDIWLVCTSTYKLPIFEISPTQILFEIPPFNGNQNDRSCRVNVTVGHSYRHQLYTYQASQTVAVSLTDLGNFQYTLTQLTDDNKDFNRVDFLLLDSQGNPTTSRYSMDFTTGLNVGELNLQPANSYLPAGTFKVLAHKEVRGFCVCTPETVTINFVSIPTIATSVASSFAGSKELTIPGIGFVDIEPQNNEIKVCGIPAPVISASQTQITIQIPALVTEATQSEYQIVEEDVIRGLTISDNGDSGDEIFDGSFNSLYSSSNSECWIGTDFGSQFYGSISSIRYVPDPTWPVASQKLGGALFEGSNDGSSWTIIFSVDTSNVHSGYNTWMKAQPDTVNYRFIRFRHDSTSHCSIAEIEFIGIIYSTQQVTIGTDKVCDVTISADSITLTSKVIYSGSETAIVTGINPPFGSSLGEQNIQITGSNFGSSLSVFIDGIECTVTSSTSQSIQCTTGRRDSPPEQGNSFVLISDGNKAIIQSEPYLYLDRWSEQSTWGGEAIPREGDSVYVPKGMTLLVDVTSTPILDSIIVEGKIKFADEQDMTLDARYFLVINGQFEAGTEINRYQHNLLITMHGGYYDRQLPIFGNKVLGCLNCKFNMHGQERTPTWTEVESTISPGDVNFRVLEPVDWKAGQSIVIASTSFEPLEAEQMTIESVSADGYTITVTTPFMYKHYSEVETYGNVQFPMRAEVGLLTRNIKMQGSEGSIEDKYGSHLMFAGRERKGLVGKISYAEFTKCGQPKVVGRYCTHFHMVGDVPKSYVRGIAVHHSIARVLTIHGTHFLLAEKNVGYYVEGHNIFVEDGIQTNNVIQDNLMITSLSSFHMLQTDITVAGFWVTNPYNTFRRNHAAGSDFYGIWYEIKEHPDGPSATSDICPMGMQLGQSKDNFAHSNRRFGLRIFKLSSRQYPCLPTKNESSTDPYLSNPAIHSLFENYVLWRNEECGFLGEELGYTTIRNFKTVDSRKGGLQFHKTNYTKELVTAEDCLVVGYSEGNRPEDVETEYSNARGVIAARTDGLKFNGITFWNFASSMTPLQSCSECFSPLLWVTGGKTTLFERIAYNNIQGNYIYWEKWRRQIFIDLDGTLTEPIRTTISPAIPQQSYATITPTRPSVMIPDHCYEIGTEWDNSVYCDETVVLRSILFTNSVPRSDFVGINIKVNRLSDPNEDITAKADEEFSLEPMIVIKKSVDIPYSWAMPFATNQYYNIHWRAGIDFMHMAIAPSRLWDQNDGVVLRFNYTDQRQLYQIFKMYKGAIQGEAITQSASMIDPATCINGQYFQDSPNERLFVCVSGREKTIQEWIDVNGIRCRLTCPQEEEEGDNSRQNFERLWSNASMWPGQVLPAEGDNVTIPYEWKVVLDVDPPILNYLHINGILRFDESREISTLQAKYIWVSQGILKAGTSEAPFTSKINIILHGEKDDDYLVLDPNSSGNKMLAVTGGLELYGVQPELVWTRLTEIAEVGATSITVESAQGWAPGDRIVIAPSYAGRTEFEQVIINSIAGNVINFLTPLEFEHYGDATHTIEKDYGILDTRSAVGIMNRNIKIVSGADANGWGYRVLVYGYMQLPVGEGPAIPRNGYAKINGVEFANGGQYDTSYAALRIERLGYHNGQIIEQTQISGSSFHDCGGFCMYLDQNMNVSISNNLFFKAKKFLAYVENVISKYSFTDNLLIGALDRQNFPTGTGLVDDVACYQQYVPIDFGTDHGVVVSNNLCQGSQGQGFVFPSTPCEYLSTYPFIDNTAGSCETAFMYETVSSQTCIGAKGAIGYASQIGLMANQPGSHTKLIYEEMIFTDNGRGITLRYAHETDENSCILRNSYFAGYSRSSCPDCYSDTKIKYCRGGYAVRMFVATISGQRFPLVKNPLGHDVICTRESFDFKAFVEDVTFQNYLYTNTLVPYCTGMNVFKRHNGASDGTASHNLINTQCINCEEKSWAYFEKPNVGWRGWFGGCGELDCTGPNNYLIYDQDGTFTGKPSQLLSNNTEIGDNQESCQFIPEMNGHWCETQDLAVLEYESIAPDFNTRKMWPVFLNYDGGPWQTVTNAWKQWQWDGPEPMNRRLARFWSVLKLHKTYNLTYNSQAPSDSRFQIQKRELPDGRSSDWAIIRIYYPVPNSIEVVVKNNTGRNIIVKPFPLKNGQPESLLNHVDTCGANNYHYENGTIEFVVNGKSNCQVRVRLTSFVQLSTRINVEYSQFFTNDGPTTLLTNIATYLNIDPGRLKIVGIKPGSVEIILQITEPFEEEPEEGAEPDPTPTQQQKLRQLTEISQSLATAIEDSSLDLGGEVLDFETQVKVVAEDGSEYTSCVDDVGSTGKVLENKECQCKLHHSWNPDALRCEPTCNDGLHLGVNSEDELTCDCRENSYWDDVERKCILDCVHIEHSLGQWQAETVCECDEISNWNKKTLTCDINCRQMQHSTGQFDFENNVCFCHEGYTTEAGFCVLDCLNMEHAISRDGEVCLCDDSSVWNEQTASCKIIDCDFIPYTAGQGQGYTCLCQQSFNWNNQLGICQLNCSALEDPLGVGHNINTFACQCQEKAIWELSALQCVYNCTDFIYSTGRNVRPGQCECVEHYRWDGSQCVLGCGFNEGEIAEFDSVEQHCVCQPEYEWSFVKHACYLKCYEIEDANPDYGPSPSDCECFTGFNWDKDLRTCTLGCDGIFDVRKIDGQKKCQCQPNAIFTLRQSKCFINCYRDYLSIGGETDPTGRCICKDNAEWNDETNKCQCTENYQRQGVTCKATTSSSTVGIVLGVVGSGGTAALVTSLIMKARMKKREKNEEQVEGPVVETNEQIKMDTDKDLVQDAAF